MYNLIIFNMIYYNKDNLKNLNRVINWGNGLSYRFLIESDGMGYSLTETIVEAQTSSYLEYKNHLEACYCIEGNGKVCIGDKEEYEIKPGVMYALNKNDPHKLIANTRMKLICVFYPALKGAETHNLSEATSSY